jgi:hypothetical protein
MPQTKNSKPTVVILGAGPAGLMHAIVCLRSRQPVKVLEKRDEFTHGRIQVLALRNEAIEILKEYGIFRVLEERGWFHIDEHALYVGIGHLENAMKTILNDLSKEPIISYRSHLIKILPRRNEKIDLMVERISQEKIEIETWTGVDLLINAEGMHSTLNHMLGNKRTEVEPRIPIMIASLRNEETPISPLCALIRTLKTFIVLLYYRLYFSLLCKKSDIVFNRIFQIYGHCLLASCLSEAKSKALQKSIDLLRLKQTELEIAKRQASIENIKKLQRTIAHLESKQAVFKHHWAHLSLVTCKNFLPLGEKFTAYRKVFERISIAEVGADYAEHGCFKEGLSLILIVGDAALTVDPRTELGCQAIIESSRYFGDLLKKLHEETGNREKIMNDIFEEYQISCRTTLEKMMARASSRQSLGSP